jgi:FtsZ-interacting cell division protein YlmF
MSSFWKKTLIWLGLEDEEPEAALPHGGMEGSPSEAVHTGYESSYVTPVGQGGTETADHGMQRPSDMAAVGTLEESPSAERYVATTYTPSSAETAGFETGSGVRMLPATETRVQIIEPHGFADAQEIGERFRQAQPVIVDLADVERDTARRIVDFASGLTFALRGRMQKVGDHVFLLLPAHASIPDEEKDRLRASGYDI